MGLQIQKLSYALGAEIIGIDYSKPIDDKTFGEIQRAFVEHSVLLLRGVPFTREEHLAFSRRFGELDINRLVRRPGLPGFPEIIVVTNKESSRQKVDGGSIDKSYQAELWHSDASQTLIPATASILRGIEIPEVGGDTMFANMSLAYETLSDGMKKIIDGLECIYVGRGARIDDSTPERLAETMRLNRIAHPLVRVHPESGRKSLFIEEKIEQFVGMTVEESKPLAQFLWQHATRPQFVYRHRWQKDDVLMWDNRCVIHKAVNDYDPAQSRYLERTTVKGLPCGYVYEGL